MHYGRAGKALFLKPALKFLSFSVNGSGGREYSFNLTVTFCVEANTLIFTCIFLWISLFQNQGGYNGPAKIYWDANTKFS